MWSHWKDSLLLWKVQNLCLITYFIILVIGQVNSGELKGVKTQLNFRVLALHPNSASSRLHPQNANQALEPTLTTQMSHRRARERNFTQEQFQGSPAKNRHHKPHPELKHNSQIKLKAYQRELLTSPQGHTGALPILTNMALHWFTFKEERLLTFISSLKLCTFTFTWVT